MSDVKAPITKPAQAEDIFAWSPSHEHYEEDFHFLFVFSCVLTIAVFSLSLILWSWQRDDSERLERLEKLNGTKQSQEPCGCCPLGDLATKGNL
jgi:hypothetical protein